MYLLNMSSEFRKRLLDAYANFKKWINMKEMIEKSSISENIQFSIKNELIYYTNVVERKRLCLLKKFEKKIFEQIHDRNNHVEFTKSYEIISTNFYFRKLANRFKQYIVYCRLCNLCQIKRHQLYDSFNSIVSSSMSFHTVSFDFIFVLSLKQSMNVILTIICKFFKKITIIIDKNTYTTKDWIIVMLDDLVDWDISRAFIHDRDRKFLSIFWTAVFKKLEISFLTSTVYHSQTNEQSERINQTVEIVLRYALTIDSNLNWVVFLLTLRTKLNNLLNAATKLSFNEVIMRFKICDALTLLKLSENDEN